MTQCDLSDPSEEADREGNEDREDGPIDCHKIFLGESLRISQEPQGNALIAWISNVARHLCVEKCAKCGKVWTKVCCVYVAVNSI